MTKRTLAAIVVAVAISVTALSTGCVRVPLDETKPILGGPNGGASSESTSALLGEAKALDAGIRIGVGDLTVSGVESATAAFTAQFTFEPESWRPETAYRIDSVDGTPTARLSLAQPEGDLRMKLGETTDSWEIGLAGGVPTDLSLKLGVGTAMVDLSDVDVRSLEAVTGVGETVIDLSGPRSADITGTITSGVGELTVRLPRGVGVQITSGEGIGDVSSEGFTGSGNVRTNEAWYGTGPKISLRIVRGVGSVTLELVD